MICIIDYGLGNLGSIKNMLRKLGFASEITNDSNKIKLASKIILPGVGSFDTGMNNLNHLGIIQLLNEKALYDKVPILGICLGAQLMCKFSEEGETNGLGWFNANVLSFKGRFASDNELTVPNMGWHEVTIEKQNELVNQLPQETRFYFVHSYFMSANNSIDILMKSEYGFKYASALSNDNLFAVQFHPEKSHKYGFQLLKNFATI